MKNSSSLKIILLAILLSFYLNCLAQTHASSKSKNHNYISLSGNIDNTNLNDTLTIYVWNDYINASKEANLPHREYKIALSSGAFKININEITKFAYLKMRLNDIDKKPNNDLQTEFFNYYLATAGDSINISVANKSLSTISSFKERNRSFVKNNLIKVTGRGFEKYECQLEMEKIRILFDEKLNRNPSFLDTVNYTIDRSFNIYDSVKSKQIRILNDYRKKVGEAFFKIAETDVLASNYLNKYYGLYNEYDVFKKDLIPNVLQSTKQKILKYYKSVYLNVLQSAVFPVTNPQILTVSKNYPEFIIYKSTIDHIIQPDKSPDVFTLIINNYKDNLRDKLITSYLIGDLENVNDFSLVEKALGVINNPQYKAIISKINDHTRIGANAYQFELPDQSGKIIKLNDFRGKVVFMDFWFTGCGACSDYYKKEIHKVEDYFKNNENVIFITVSIDADKEKWIKSIKQGIYTSDSSKNVINLYTAGLANRHPIFKYYNMSGCPRPLLIDKEGKIFNARDLDLRNGDSINPPLIKYINNALR